MLEKLEIIRDAFPRTVRLVTTARLRASVLLDLVEEGDLAALSEIEGATSTRLLAEARGTSGIAARELLHGVPHARFVNASFAYAKPRDPNRFNGAERGAWYSALAVETAIAEVTFHLTKALADAGDFNAVVDYAEMFASLAGEFVDLRQTPDHPSLSPDKAKGYPVGNALADATRARGLNGIIYPSVRHAGGTCFAVLFPYAVQSVAQGDVHRITWSGTPVPTIARIQA